MLSAGYHDRCMFNFSVLCVVYRRVGASMNKSSFERKFSLEYCHRIYTSKTKFTRKYVYIYITFISVLWFRIVGVCVFF